MQASGGACRLSVHVAGHVQGVGYRFFARRSATTLGLVGYVRNLPDGAVEVVAEGLRPLLEQYLAALRRGPKGAHVTQAEATWGVAGGGFAGFAVRH